MTLRDRIVEMPRELKLFAIASLLMGVSYSMFDSVFNNFLKDHFALTAFQRSFLEFPRELPGLTLSLITAGVWFLASRRLGAVAMIVGAIGALLIAFSSGSYGIMTLWLFFYSLGQHVFMPLAATIGMELAREGHIGRRLGQLNAIRNIAAILGSTAIALGFRFLGLNYQITFVIAAVGFILTAMLLFVMKPGNPQPPGDFLKLHKEYKVFYALSVLYGSRKQLFITFAPWVLVKVLQQPTEILATLFTIGGVVGILFQPFLGWAVDRFGERVVLTAEAVLLAIVCTGYGFAYFWFSQSTALLVVAACFLVDQMLMSVGMARSTYVRKIAKRPEDVQTTLTAGITIDHVFSISVALLGGVIWDRFGFQYVFLLGTFIAVINFFVALRVHIPQQAAVTPAVPAVAGD
jgi:predicted MFS family arabinose efflux permease